jgi:hypothetical protein
MSEFATHLVWENQTFPEPRLATIVVERPIPIVAKLFGVWEQDIETNFPHFPTDVTTYDGLFRLVQEVIVDQVNSLIARAAESVHLFVPRTEVWTRVLELARWDAQQATLHFAQEIWYHAACRDDPHAVAGGLLRDWAPEHLWTFLDLAEAIKVEGSARGWERAEPSLPPAEAPTPGGPRTRFLGLPLRSALPGQARKQPFAESDWFARRATTTTIGAKVSRRKRAQGRTRPASGPGGEAGHGVRGDSVGSTPDDADSLASEPEDAPSADPLDPEPDFRRHPNQWRLWVMRQERRKAERAASESIVSSREPGRPAPVQLKSMPIKPFKGDQDDIDRFLRGCDAHFRLT